MPLRLLYDMYPVLIDLLKVAGRVFGMICVADGKPRKPSESQSGEPARSGSRRAAKALESPKAIKAVVGFLMYLVSKSWVITTRSRKSFQRSRLRSLR